MKRFAEQLEKAVNQALPSKIKPYNGVYVLATHWSNDDMDVGPLENDLCNAFEILYGYTVEKYLIDATKSLAQTRKALRKRLEKFTDDYDMQGNLLILVYSGHAAEIDFSGKYLLA